MLTQNGTAIFHDENTMGNPSPWIDLSDLPLSLTRAEREYAQEQTARAKDDSERHRVMLWCWDQVTGTFRLRFVYHPTDQQLLIVMQELTPFFAQSHQQATCPCMAYYANLQDLMQQLHTTTVSFRFDLPILRDVLTSLHHEHKEIPRTVLRQLRALRDQTYLSMQDVANALIKLLSDDQITQYGDRLIAALRTFGVNDEIRHKRIAELQAELDIFHGAIPKRPDHPTTEPCPFCHLPYAYSFLEWLTADMEAIQRCLHILIGAPLMAGELKKYLDAVERWLFAMIDTADDQKKKLSTWTLTELMFTHLINAIKAAKIELMEKLTSEHEPTPSSIISGNNADLTGPPPPPLIPPVNSTSISDNTSNAN
jgi:hypothetical protein